MEDLKKDSKFSNASLDNGKRPFFGAIEKYNEYMSECIKTALDKLQQNEHFDYINVMFNPKQIFNIELENGSSREYPAHMVHYGPIKKYKHKKSNWRFRDDTIWKKLDVYPPFRTFQEKLGTQNLYLIDISDPEKSKKTIIRIYRTVPEKPLYLWHGYGVIPGLGKYIKSKEISIGKHDTDDEQGGGAGKHDTEDEIDPCNHDTDELEQGGGAGKHDTNDEQDDEQDDKQDDEQYDSASKHDTDDDDHDGDKVKSETNTI